MLEEFAELRRMVCVSGITFRPRKLRFQILRYLLRDGDSISADWFGNICYFHEDRIHDRLEKDTPNRRPVEKKPCPKATVVSIPRLGGLLVGTAGANQHGAAGVTQLVALSGFLRWPDLADPVESGDSAAVHR